MAKMTSFFGLINSDKINALLQLIHDYEQEGKKVLLIKHQADMYEAKHLLSYANLSKRVDIILENDKYLLEEYMDQVLNCDVIVADETTFFTINHINELWAISKELNIPVFTYNIKSNTNVNIFLSFDQLLVKSDENLELANTPRCKCGGKARFKVRKKDDLILVGPNVDVDGSSENIRYEVLCNDCYYKNLKDANLGIAKIMSQSLQRKKVKDEQE